MESPEIEVRSLLPKQILLKALIKKKRILKKNLQGAQDLQAACTEVM